MTSTCTLCGQPAAWGEYATGAKVESGLCPDCWHRPFAIASVCRADLQQYLSPEEIAKLEDCDMERLADKLADAYLERVFQTDLEIAAEELFGSGA